MITSTIPVFNPAFPEIFLVACCFLQLGAGLVLPKSSFYKSYYGALFSLLVTFVLVLLQPSEFQTTFNGMFLNNSFTLFIKAFLLLGSILVVLLTRYSLSEELNKPEYFCLLQFSILGMMILISAHDFLTLFVGIELQSLSLYILAGLKRHDRKANEAALKYFILGALSTGFLLYGCSLIYGYTGTTHFEALERFFKHAAQTDSTLFGPLIGVTLIIAALGFKVSAAPFHMWAPDVYEGTPTAITAFLASVPKVAAFAICMRVLWEPFEGLIGWWYGIVATLAVLSMILGAVAALTQTNIKRLIAYSSIGHVGFALVGVLVGNEYGLKSALVYLVFYMLTTLGFFGALLHIERRGNEVKNLSDLSGIGRVFPAAAFILGFMLFSMAGIPPLPGFVPKLLVLQTAVGHSAYILASIAVIYTVIAAAYYLLILKAIFIDKPVAVHGVAPQYKKLNTTTGFILFGLAIFLFGLVIQPNLLLKWASDAATALVYT